jgi:hypothetical protein
LTADREAIVKYLREVAALYNSEEFELVLHALEVCAQDIEERHPDTLPVTSNKPPQLCQHPSKATILSILGDKVTELPLSELMGLAMRGLGGKANPQVVRELILELQLGEVHHD